MAQKTNPPSISTRAEPGRTAARMGGARADEEEIRAAGSGPRARSTADEFANDVQGVGKRILAGLFAEFRRAFHRTPLARLKIRRDRRLRLRETLSLGERRLVAILECDSREYLVAATGQTVSLLAPLEPPTAGGGPVVAELRRATRAGR